MISHIKLTQSCQPQAGSMKAEQECADTGVVWVWNWVYATFAATVISVSLIFARFTEPHSWAQALWCSILSRLIKQVMQEQWSKQVLKGLKQRHLGLGEMRKKEEEKVLETESSEGLRKPKERYFQGRKKYRSESKIQAFCFVVLQRCKTDARPCKMGAHTYIDMHTNTHTFKLFIYVHIFSKTSSLKFTNGNFYTNQQLWMGQWHASMWVQCI